MKRNDFLLLCLILAVSLLLLFGFWLVSTLRDAETVVVEVDGEVYAELPLDRDTVLEIVTDDGSNTLVIENGEAYISEADCPDLVCVRTGRLSATRSIACLPHRVLVYLSEE